MARRPKIQHIGVIGKRWFDRANGNTYNSVQIFVNGDRVATLGRGYGYGDYYEQRAVQWLVKHGYLPEVEERGGSSYKPLWQYASDLGFKKDVQAIDVKRKKDLDEGARCVWLMARRAKIQHIGLIGKRWRDRVNGNTYNSVQIMVNGKTVATLAQGYGGGSMYEDRAAVWLVKNGYLPEIERLAPHMPNYKSIGQYARDLGFKYDSQVLDVPRKKDLDKGVYE